MAVEEKSSKLGDEALRKVCKPMQKFDLRLWLLLRDMADTMYKADGVGLAAPQVGILRRVVVIDVQDEHGLIELVNPEIISAEGEQGGSEGCLSVPGKRGYVVRPQKVTVKAQDRKGKPFEVTGEGLFARALCHEIDHLDGKLYIDIMDHEIVEDEEEGAMSLRVVFMGTPDYGVPSLEALISAGYDVVGVFCQPDKPSGRGKKITFCPVKQLRAGPRHPRVPAGEDPGGRGEDLAALGPICA